MGRGPLAGDAGAKEEKSHVGVYLENKYLHRTAVNRMRPVWSRGIRGREMSETEAPVSLPDGGTCTHSYASGP